jgi:hypothetical protein
MLQVICLMTSISTDIIPQDVNSAIIMFHEYMGWTY